MAYIHNIYSDEFREKIETLLPEHYCINQYYKSKNNQNQYIMCNSKGYFHVMIIAKNDFGFTFNHYRIDKTENLVDTGAHYNIYKTIEEARESMKGIEQ